MTKQTAPRDTARFAGMVEVAYTTNVRDAARKKLDAAALALPSNDRWFTMNRIAAAGFATTADCVELNALVSATANQEDVSRDSILQRLDA